jgi:hypothetical protein
LGVITGRPEAETNHSQTANAKGQNLTAGASIVRTENGKITDWADYYDRLSSRRTVLAAHFEEWVEL